ncbi:MAG: hypothetical protein JWO75_6342 [Actinomycetia bacterium]|nr:hypothetical protein [Actinomycetes bacterium]
MRLKPTVNARTCRIAVVTWAVTPIVVTAERVAGGNSTRTMRMPAGSSIQLSARPQGSVGSGPEWRVLRKSSGT